jgi:hypothetical protein
MAKRLPKILSLAAALAALSGVTAVNSTPAAANTTSTDEAGTTQSSPIASAEPNVFMSVGSNLLGLIVTTAADGTVVADHYSHVSHSSHSSHRSHYSGG